MGSERVRWVLMAAIEMDRDSPHGRDDRRTHLELLEAAVREVYGPTADLVDFRLMAAQPSTNRGPSV